MSEEAAKPENVTLSKELGKMAKRLKEVDQSFRELVKLAPDLREKAFEAVEPLVRAARSSFKARPSCVRVLTKS